MKPKLTIAVVVKSAENIVLLFRRFDGLYRRCRRKLAQNVRNANFNDDLCERVINCATLLVQMHHYNSTTKKIIAEKYLLISAIFSHYPVTSGVLARFSCSKIISSVEMNTATPGRRISVRHDYHCKNIEVPTKRKYCLYRFYSISLYVIICFKNMDYTRDFQVVMTLVIYYFRLQ